MPWVYNAKTLNFENNGTPPPPPPVTGLPADPNALWNDNGTAPGGEFTLQQVQQQQEFLTDPKNNYILQELLYPSSSRQMVTDSNGKTYPAPEGGSGPRKTGSGGPSSGGSRPPASGGSFGGSEGGSSWVQPSSGGSGGAGGSGGSGDNKPPTADDLLPGAGLLSKIPAPPGYAWSINPLTGDPEPVDLTPLDQTKPISGWKWITTDPAKPEDGHWTFVTSPDVLDKPFEGIPGPVIDWLKVALDNGGNVESVPEGPARQWVQFILTQATNPGRQPGSVPFGQGVPSFDRSGTNFPTNFPAPPTSAVDGLAQEIQTLIAEGGDTSAIQEQLAALQALFNNSQAA